MSDDKRPKWKKEAMLNIRDKSDCELFDLIAYACTDRFTKRCEWIYDYTVMTFRERMKQKLEGWE